MEPVPAFTSTQGARGARGSRTCIALAGKAGRQQGCCSNRGTSALQITPPSKTEACSLNIKITESSAPSRYSKWTQRVLGWVPHWAGHAMDQQLLSWLSFKSHTTIATLGNFFQHHGFSLHATTYRIDYMKSGHCAAPCQKGIWGLAVPHAARPLHRAITDHPLKSCIFLPHLPPNLQIYFFLALPLRGQTGLDKELLPPILEGLVLFSSVCQ